MLGLPHKRHKTRISGSHIMAQWGSVNREPDEETTSVGTHTAPASTNSRSLHHRGSHSRRRQKLLLGALLEGAHVFFFTFSSFLGGVAALADIVRFSNWGLRSSGISCCATGLFHSELGVDRSESCDLARFLHDVVALLDAFRERPIAKKDVGWCRVLGLCDLFGMSSSDETLVRWGLHLLEVVGGAIDQNNQANNQATTNSQPLAPAHSTTENDELIARTLQEQLYSAGSIDDTGDCDCDCAATTQQAPEVGDFFDRKDGHEHQVLNDYGLVTSDASAGAPAAMGGGEMGNSCSTSGDQNESDEAIAVVLSEELAQLDGEVGRRLTHMESIPHIPKINGEIPSADDASADHQRLIDRLQVYGLMEHKIPGDGNCQFRALSDQFYRTPDHHMFVRKEVVKQLKHDPEPYEGYVPMKYNEYLKKMAKNGEWGDHVTLQAAADTYGIKICLITSFKDTCIVEIVPKDVKSDRVIFLSFWAEVHYNSVYPQGEVPISYHVKKKRHWFSFFG